MFRNCYSLEHLEMPKLITDKIGSANKLFENCSSLKSININFSMKSALYLDSMFKNFLPSQVLIYLVLNQKNYYL